MKKVIITGATGFIGYHLIREMRSKGVEIWALCRKSSKERAQMEMNGIHIIECDLDNILELPEICYEREFDVFYHLAWEGASGPLRRDYNVQLTNVKKTCDCVRVAKYLNCRKIVVTGTICENQCSAIEKEKYFMGSSYYLMAKKYANILAKNISKELNISLIWCHFYHPIGIFNKKEQLIANTIQKLLCHEELKFGSAKELFDVIDVKDLAHALYLMGEKKLKKNTYFIGSGNPRALKEYLEITKDYINASADMQYEALNTICLPMEKEWLDISSFHTETGFIPSITFQESIKAMKRWMENEVQYDSKKWLF